MTVDQHGQEVSGTSYTPSTAYTKLSLTTPVVVSLAVAFVAVVAGFVVITVTGQSTTDFSAFVGRMLNAVSALGSIGAFTFAADAARKSGRAVQQTNGSLDARMRAIVKDENARQTKEGG